MTEEKEFVDARESKPITRSFALMTLRKGKGATKQVTESLIGMLLNGTSLEDPVAEPATVVDAAPEADTVDDKPKKKVKKKE